MWGVAGRNFELGKRSLCQLGVGRQKDKDMDKIFISALEQKRTAGGVCQMQRSIPIQPCRGGIMLYSARIAKVKREIFGGGCSKANAQKANTGTKYAKGKKQ
jgi:hypothetical protein